jgi:hypothetical protein
VFAPSPHNTCRSAPSRTMKARLWPQSFETHRVPRRSSGRGDKTGYDAVGFRFGPFYGHFLNYGDIPIPVKGALLLHGQSAGAEASPARRPYRALARGGRDDAGRNHPFTTDAFVVLSDHLHAVWTLPPGDFDVSTRWRLIKSRFARALPKRDRLGAVRKARAACAASGNGGFGSISSAMTPITPDMSNIATSIRSSTALFSDFDVRIISASSRASS